MVISIYVTKDECTKRAAQLLPTPAGLARQCQIQVAYAIGVARPMNVTIYLTLENVSGIAGMSVQHLSEIASSKRDPRLSSIEHIADAMELAVLLVPEHITPDIRRYIASQGRVFTSTQSTKETRHDDPA